MESGWKSWESKIRSWSSAMAGLCDGVKCGSICGTASAAVCLIYLADPKAAEQGLVQEYLDWFEESFGALDCHALLGADPDGEAGKMSDAAGKHHV